MTTFKSAIQVCGLSQRATAEFLGVALDTVKSWCSGRANPPIGVWQMLATLYAQIEDAANFAADHMALEGTDPRTWNNLEENPRPDNTLPDFAARTVGAMALLMALADSEISN